MNVFLHIQGWRTRRSAMRELGRIMREDEETYQGVEGNPLSSASRAVKEGNLDTARTLWDEARRRMPNQVLQSPDSIEILLGLDRLDELEALLMSGGKGSRATADRLQGLARLAERRGHLAEAARWWSKLRRHTPKNLDGWVGEAKCLQKIGLKKKAAVVLRSAQRSFPDNKDFLVEAGAIFELIDQPREALRVWSIVAELCELPVGFANAARILEHFGNVDEALRLLVHGRTKFPYDAHILIALAGLHERQGDFDLAARHWSDLRLSQPQSDLATREEIRCLRLAGRADDADLLASRDIGKSKT